jgi:hypothetical protein
VLREGSYVGESVRDASGRVSLSFDILSVIPGTEGYFVKIPGSYLRAGKEYALYIEVEGVEIGADGKEVETVERFVISRFFRDSQSDYTVVNVSPFVDGLKPSFILDAGEGVINESKERALLDSVNGAIKSAAEAAETIILDDLSAVTEDITGLPDSAGAFDIVWQSSDQRYLGNNGRIDRPYSSEGDMAVELAAVVEVDGYVYKKVFLVTVLKQRGESSSGFPELKDPMHVSDDNFFGVWNTAQNRWTTSPILRYDKLPALSAVAEQVKKGDYAKAKDELLIYYRNRDTVPDYKLPTGQNYVSAEMMTEKIYGWMQVDNVAGLTTVTPEWKYYTVDLTVSQTVPQGLFLIESEADGSSVEIYSREREDGKYGAYLEVVIDGVKRTFPVIADTYISAGDNQDTNYGGGEIMYSRESYGESGDPPLPNPFGTETRRPYFRFDPGQMTGTVSSIKFSFYARTDSGKDKKVFVFTSGNQKNFVEDEFVWSKHNPMIFNFKNTGYVWDNSITNRWKLENEWQNYGTRLYPVGWLIPRFKSTGNELYAYRALEFMMELYTQQADSFFPRGLEAGWRTEYNCILFFGTLYSNTLTPEVLTAQLKYYYNHVSRLPEISINGAFNQISAQLCGAIRTMLYFPEIEIDGKWKTAKDKLNDLYQTAMNKDGSYIEATSGYISGVVAEIKMAYELVGLRDGSDDEYYEKYLGYYSKLVKYMFDMTMPYGLTVNYGDGPRANNKAFAYNEWVAHPEIDPNRYFEYFYTQGLSGKEPDYTSINYADKAIAFLKSGWKTDDFGAVINANFGGTHSHPDDLSLNVSAYGAVLLTEAGGGSYTANSKMAGIGDQTYSHNTIEIDKKSQKGYDYNSIKVNKPQTLKLATNKIFDFVRAATKNAYTGMNVNRKVLFLHNKYWLVSDYIIPSDNNPHIYKQAWRPDVRNNLTVDPDTKAMKTHYAKGPNIKVAPADPEKLDARVESSYVNNPTYGEEITDYIRYCKEGVTGTQTFDTVIYPDRQGEDTYLDVKRISVPGVSVDKATALKIDFGLSTGYYYSSNETDSKEDELDEKGEKYKPEELPRSTRSFGNYSTDGQMAYAEVDGGGNMSSIALTNARMLKRGNVDLVKSKDALADLGIQWSGKTLKLSTESGALSTAELDILSEKEIENVTLNGAVIAFKYDKDTKKVSLNYTPKPSPPPASAGSNKMGSPAGNNNASNPLVKPEPAKPEPDSGDIFTDISEHWAKDEIMKALDAGVVTPSDDRLFRPDDNVTRAEFAAFMVRALKIPTGGGYDGVFNDVGEEDWFAEIVEGAKRAGIVNGYGDGRFEPNSLISRQEMAKMLLAACDYAGLEYGGADIASLYSDYGDISDWAVEAAAAVTGLGLVQGMEGRFAPLENATRAQAVVVTSRLLSLETPR